MAGTLALLMVQVQQIVQIVRSMQILIVIIMGFAAPCAPDPIPAPIPRPVPSLEPTLFPRPDLPSFDIDPKIQFIGQSWVY